MIQKIINELSDNNKSLVNPLLKTKILATRLGNESLLNWVNNELTGYEEVDENDVPLYRIAKAIPLCNLQQGYTIKENTPFPISLLPEDFARKIFLEFPLYEGVHTLENYQKHEKGELTKMTAIDFCSYVTSEFRKNGFNLKVTNISITAHVSSITQTLAEIRTKFLDLMLALEQEFPDFKDVKGEGEKNIEKINKEITFIMNKITIKNSKGSTINTGNSNQINSNAGSNNNQNILTTEVKDKIAELMTKIRTALEEHEIEDKEDVILEVQRVENQIKKESPNKTIISQSLNAVNSFLLSVVANAWTDPILLGIKNIMISIG